MAKLKIDIPEVFLADEAKTLVVSSETKRLWAVELDLLAEFDRVCKKHGLKYFAISGTLIGAVRHQGFIPWDDDVDVVMRRKDYDKLLAIANVEFRHPYFLQTNDADPGSARGHAQLRNSETTGALKREMVGRQLLFTFNQGIFMDIFPIDNIPNDETECKLFYSELSTAKMKIWRIRNGLKHARNFKVLPKSLGSVKWALKGLFWHLVGLLFSKDFLAAAVRDFDGLLRRYADCDCKRCAAMALSQPPRKHEIFDVSDFERSVRLPFEFLQISVPECYEKVLTQQFGNWQRHVIGANGHGGMFVDVDTPYTAYIRK